MKKFETELTDDELNRLLAVASEPEAPAHFEQAMAQRLAQRSTAQIIAFPARVQPRHQARTRLPLAAALAASLVLGVWLGNQSQIANLFDGNSEVAMLGSAQDFAPEGIEVYSTIDTDSAT